jgi:hypothetical protein
MLRNFLGVAFTGINWVHSVLVFFHVGVDNRV